MKKALVILFAAAALAALAGCSSDESGNGGGGEAAVAGQTGSAQGAAGSGGGYLPAQGEDSARPAAQTNPLPASGPKVIQTASLRVSVRRGRFDDVVDEARAVATSLGGFVVSSSAAQAAGQRLERGTLVIRIPGRSYADAMARLADLGRVEARRESGQDVSAEYVDLASRVRHLEAVERQLLELLDRARSVASALAVQSTLNEVQLNLEQTRGRLRFLDDQVAYATVSLSVYERRGVVGATDGERWGIVEAWERAARGFVAVVGWIFVALASAAPVLLLLALLWLAARSGAGRRLLGRRAESPSGG